jgi:hypothetical protein
MAMCSASGEKQSVKAQHHRHAFGMELAMPYMANGSSMGVANGSLKSLQCHMITGYCLFWTLLYEVGLPSIHRVAQQEICPPQ